MASKQTLRSTSRSIKLSETNGDDSQTSLSQNIHSGSIQTEAEDSKDYQASADESGVDSSGVQMRLEKRISGPIEKDRTQAKQLMLMRQEVHESLIDLYLDVKVRSNEEITNLNDQQLEREKGKLAELDTLVLVEYIKTSIEILLNLKMDTSLSVQSKHDHSSRNKLLDSSQLNNSQATNSSNCGSSLNLKEPPRAYEEMLQKLENDIRNHIRIEQQMKIAMENLQQKVEDKDREKTKIRLEYKTCIVELKQDKKRYEELLELRDQELIQLGERTRKFEEQEKQYQASLSRLQTELELFKQLDCRKEVRPPNESKSRSTERTNGIRSSILGDNKNLSRQSNQSFLKKGQSNSNLSSSIGRKNSASGIPHSKKSPDRQSMAFSHASGIVGQNRSPLKPMQTTSKANMILQQSAELVKGKEVQSKKSFLTIHSTQEQMKLQAARLGDQSHRKSNSSNYVQSNISSMKAFVTHKQKKSAEKPQQKSPVPKETSRPNGSNFNTILSQPIADEGMIAHITFPQKSQSNFHPISEPDSVQRSHIQILHSNDDSFGATSQQNRCNFSVTQSKEASDKIRVVEACLSMMPDNYMPLCKTRANSSGSLNSTQSNFRRQKDSKGSKIISSKRLAANDDRQYSFKQSKLCTALLDQQSNGRQSLGQTLTSSSHNLSSRGMVSSASVSSMQVLRTGGGSQSFSKLFLTHRK